MVKIKFRLAKFEKRLCFEVLEQIPLRANFKFKASNGFEVIAYIESCKDNKIYIRSLEEVIKNDRFTSITFNDNKERDIYHNKILKALEEASIII